LKDIVLYCKSYSKDFLRLRNLLASIEQYNTDRLDFYISTSESERAELERQIGSQGYRWVSDESIVRANPRVPSEIEKTKPGGLAQQVIKSEFWRLGVANIYVCLDSDCIFIQDFRKSDFLASDGHPYTVIYQNKEYHQLAINRNYAKAPHHLQAEAERVKAVFGRNGPNYYCPCPPFIWSAAVWQSLDNEYLKPRGQTLWDLCSREHPETFIYNEAVLNFRAIPLHPIEQLFRVYYYDWHYFLLRRLGESIPRLKENYLGVIYQSSWDLSLDLGPSKKSIFSRALKKIKRLGRYLQSYI
jgi:hypothetical protein